MKNRSIAKEGMLVLLFVRQRELMSGEEGQDPLELIQYLGHAATICASIVEQSGGQVVSVAGNSILAAWSEADAPNIDFVEIGRSLVQQIAVPAGEADRQQRNRRAISISFSYGRCVFEKTGESFTRVLGDPVNRVMRIVDVVNLGDGNAIVLDESMGRFDKTDVGEAMDGGVRKILVRG